MFNKHFSPKLRRAWMGFALGLAAALIYMIFLMAHQVSDSDPMILVPVGVITSPSSSN